jgi:hypothetical protein
MTIPALKDDGILPSPTLDSSVRQARHILAMRQTRHEYFPDMLFGEPGWDLLLQLFVAEAERRQLSVEQCLGLSTAPASTTTRWIRLLVDQGLVIEEEESVILTVTARQALKAFLRQFAEASPYPAWRRSVSRTR